MTTGSHEVEAISYQTIFPYTDLLLHDGRARSEEEAILWHGDEGEAAREAFRNLTPADREALLEFVESR